MPREWKARTFVRLKSKKGSKERGKQEEMFAEQTTAENPIRCRYTTVSSAMH